MSRNVIGVVVLLFTSLFFSRLALASSTSQVDYIIEPLFTQSGQIYPVTTVNAFVKYFHNMNLQEANKFDGTGAGFDLTVPIFSHDQIRLYLPVYTNGNATNRLTGNRIGIKSYNGTTDFPSIRWEHQFLTAGNHGFNLLGYVGAGFVFSSLTTSNNGGDNFNHRGRDLIFGVNLDKKFQNQIHMFGNADFAYYYDSDDLNPEGLSGSDVFTLANFRYAAMFRPWGAVYPVVEALYTTNFKKYNAVYGVPELVFAVNRYVDLKLGVPVG